MATIYENWISMAYDKTGAIVNNVWDVYLPLEQKIYESMLSTKNAAIKGTLKELADKHGMTNEFFLGFLDGINEALDSEINTEELAEDTEIDRTVDFECLYKKMVEYKADHLHSLPEWSNVFSEEELKRMYVEQKRSTTVRREEAKVGRNDACPCGSGKKYKKCCA